MSIDFPDITNGTRLTGVVAGGPATVIAFELSGDQSGTLTYEAADGSLGRRILLAADLEGISMASDCRWTFDADGAMFRLASEARRMKNAHLSDPFAAVDTSAIEPYPHQIEAVYEKFLNQRPLRYLLADDPGAGKTIMSGLLIRELMIRGDVARCLIVAPGSLVEQWQDELWEKFGLSFDLMSRAAVEEARTGNPFIEKQLLVARVDQLARSEELTAKLEQSEWDLVIVDEAHKMSAHQYGNELRKTKRFELGEVLRERTRHFLLLTATPHNGKNEDFLAFMTLLDPERFGGRLRGGELPDTSDVMRRYVKENLRTFDGELIFPPRQAESLKFELSPIEHQLYESVTDYVRHGMNKAAEMRDGADKRRGVIVGFALAGLQRRLASSPAAIYHSLRRRTERLRAQADELRRLAAGGKPVPIADLPKGVKIADLEDFDFDAFDDEELEELEDAVIDAAAAATTAADLEAELVELAELVKLADEVRASNVDTKWIQLRTVLRSPEFQSDTDPRKLIVFSEHKDTLTYLEQRISDELGRPEAVETIHGGVKREERRAIQERFRVDPRVRVLVATDAAGEGVNLQVANLMVNYDLPWNPNRIEQRFGRIHRIGQKRRCHLWNLVAHKTREGQVFDRLFEKIEQQRQVYGDQVYDVLGDSMINIQLQDLLIRAIQSDDEPADQLFTTDVIEQEIGKQLEEVLKERALVAGLGAPAASDDIRDLMERAKARKLQPWFVESFFSAGLELFGGRMARREAGRYEVTRVPAKIRAQADPAHGIVHDRYHRVTFDKNHVDAAGSDKAILISPGNPLLTAVVDKVLADHGGTLQAGATLIDPVDASLEPRLLVYLDHAITDGRIVNGQRQVVSRRFQYVEIDAAGQVTDPGAEPYLEYVPISEEQVPLLEKIDSAWADTAAEDAAQRWAVDNLAGPHFREMEAITKARVDKVRLAVDERLVAEIRHWDMRVEEIKREELAGKRPKISSGRARQRAEDLEARKARRRLELDLEADIANAPPRIVGAALVIPQGLLDSLTGAETELPAKPDTERTDRIAVAAVMDAERALGRVPEEQAHNNPGFDIESLDPATGVRYCIEVKGHLPETTEIKVSNRQVNLSKTIPDRWRLAVVSVSRDDDADAVVRYLVNPFQETRLHFAQPHVPLTVASLLERAGDPV
ncbi:MAG: helicase-related protein [Acidimicrobiales bacterium]|nr:helicase-related protein [Acidimicrobiales bacterium]